MGFLLAGSGCSIERERPGHFFSFGVNVASLPISEVGYDDPDESLGSGSSAGICKLEGGGLGLEG